MDAIETLDIQRFPKQYENMMTEAVLLSEKIACKLRSLMYASTDVRKPAYLKKAADVHGIEITYQDEILSIVLPRLLPKRGGKYSSLFLMEPLHAALEEFTETEAFPKFGECTVCIVHYYDKRVFDKPLYDFDNLQQKQLLDTIAAHVLIDDSASLCNVFCTALCRESNYTKVYIMEKERFKEWLPLPGDDKN